MALENPAWRDDEDTTYSAFSTFRGPAWFQLPLMRTPNILRQMVHGQHCQRLLDNTLLQTIRMELLRSLVGLFPHALDSENLSKELLAADGNWYPLSTFPNTKIASGVVAAGGNNSNKVWKTDGTGNPAWRDDEDTTYSAFSTSGAGLVPAPTNADTKYLAANGTWTALPASLGTILLLQTIRMELLRSLVGTVPHPLDSEILSKELLAADGNWYPLSTFPNTKIASGVVAAGGNNSNKVWKTDGTWKSRMER